MQLFNLYFHHFSRKLQDDFWQFELSILLHAIARSLITIFVPILLLQIGFSIVDVIVYLALYHGLDVPLNLLARKSTAKLGARKTLILGKIAAVAYFAILFFLDVPDWTTLAILALVAAIYDTLYWVSHIYLFIETSKEKEDVGKSTGILYAVRRFGTLLGPIAGATILIFAGRDALIVASIVFFVLSIIPLFYMETISDKPKTTRLSWRKFFASVYERKDYFSRFLYAIHAGAERFLWPLFIFLVFGSIESVAAVPVIIALTTMIFSYFTGAFSRYKREHLIMLGALLLAAVWMLRIAFEGEVILYLSVFLVGLFSLLISIPLDSSIFDRARKTDILSAAMYRNISSMGAKFILFAVLAIAIGVFQTSFIIAMMALFLLFIVNFLFFARQQKGAS